MSEKISLDSSETRYFLFGCNWLLYSEILRLEKAFFKRSFNERKDNVYF